MRIVFRRFRVRSKPEKSAASSPMKLRRARGVRALGMLLLVKRRALKISRMTLQLGAFALGSITLLLQAPNGSAQPLCDRLLNLPLIVIAIERFERFTKRVQRNVPTRNSFTPALLRHQFHKNTFIARMRFVG